VIPISDTKTSGRFPFWVFVILAINIWVFYLELTSLNIDFFIQQFALVPGLVDFSNYASLTPFVTSQFLHGGFIHIISNMWFLWIFADNVEERFGFFLFPVFYLLAGVAGGLAQYITMSDSNIPMLGASGAIAGVLGAYLALFPFHKIKTLVPIFGFFTILELPASFVLLLWFFTQLFSGSASILSDTASMGGVAFLAHAGGFTFGWLAGKLVQ
jgi:membrane associated rhomboid family serine protease